MMGPPWIVFLLAIASAPTYAKAHKGRRVRLASRGSRSAEKSALVRDETLVSYRFGHSFSGTISQLDG